ncbi:MAG TPA: hypothetical protein VGL22_00210 [Terracidiphilus sp.]|jgi:hypothetical protein
MGKLGRLSIGFCLLAALAFAAQCFGQSSLVGEWEGTLNAGGNEVHIAWHVTAGAAGVVTSTFDNKDEGVYGIKVKDLVLTGSKLTLAIDDQVEVNGSAANIRGTFDGTVSADGNEVTGTWTQTDPQEEPPAEIHFKRSAPQAPSTPATPKN